jgi:hypothetical protein
MVEVDTGIVLLDGKSGKYWDLNPTGALVLQALLDGNSTQEAAADLAREYEIDGSEAAEDALALLTNLKEAGLVFEARGKGTGR